MSEPATNGEAGDPGSLIAPIRARAVAYSKATARATVQGVPSLLAAVRVRPFTRLLDIACGPGYGAGAATALGVRAVGVDISGEMVAVARARHPQTEFRIGDATKLDLPDDAFDFVICNFGVIHFEDPAAALREAHRVLRRGGRVAFTQWRGPEASPFFEAVGAALEEVGDETAPGLNPASFRLSTAEECASALSAAGFVDMSTRDIPIVYEAPGGDFLEILEDLALPIPTPRRDSDRLEALRDALNARMCAFKSDGGYAAPMPAALACGLKSS